jgi:hypothetical protein
MTDRFEQIPTAPGRPVPSAVATSAADAETTAGQGARSVANIALWNTYLPKDCVDSMISLGWDATA